MAISRSKVAIIGVGNVGTALAHHLVISNICDDLLLIGRNREKVWAEVTDLKHSLGYSDAKMRVFDGNYEDCRDADIVVLSVAAPYRTGMTRLDMLSSAAKIVSGIIPAVMRSGFDGIFLVITNPVDSITWLVRRLSGLPDHRVIGTGTSLDSARLRQRLAEVMDVDARSVEAMCLGEHGDSQIIPWSQVTVGAKKFSEIKADFPERFGSVDFGAIAGEIAGVAYRVVKAKGATNYGIAAVAAKIIRSVIRDENSVIPASVIPHGEYGLHDICLGLPAVVTIRGIKELVEYHLADEELAGLKASADVLHKANASLGWQP